MKPMRLHDKMIKNGHLLFKYRGQFPLLLLFASIIIIYNTDCCQAPDNTKITIQILAIIIALLGLILRYFTIGTTPEGTSGRNRDEQIAKQLNTTGIYSIVRNPLYLANYIIWISIAIYALNVILMILISLVFFIYYERIILTEEEYLLQKFKNKYIAFCQKVPVFIPYFKNYQKSQHPLSVKKILKQEYSTTISTIIVFLYIDGVIHYFCNSTIYIKPIYIQILIISLGLTVLLKIIKTYSDILEN